MGEFEREYYESPQFWEGEMLQDEQNLSRFKTTAALIPGDVQNLADIGCGNGVFVNYLTENGHVREIIGVDRSNAALEYVKTKKTNAEATNLPFQNSSFDCVTCLEVLEHLPIKDYELALAELARVSRKYIIVSVPFEEPIEESYTKCPSCKSIFNYELHLRRFDEEGFSQLFSKHGFSMKSSDKLGSSTRYKGHFAFRKLFYPEQLLKWRSPVCPICGYKDSEPSKRESANLTINKQRTNRKLISYLSWLPKLFWPKEKRYYWILGLFIKD